MHSRAGKRETNAPKVLTFVDLKTEMNYAIVSHTISKTHNDKKKKKKDMYSETMDNLAKPEPKL